MSAAGNGLARAVSAGPARFGLAAGGTSLGAVAAWQVDAHPISLLLITAVVVGLAQQALP
jgi:hypothetical protein